MPVCSLSISSVHGSYPCNSPPSFHTGIVHRIQSITSIRPSWISSTRRIVSSLFHRLFFFINHQPPILYATPLPVRPGYVQKLYGFRFRQILPEYTFPDKQVPIRFDTDKVGRVVSHFQPFQPDITSDLCDIPASFQDRQVCFLDIVIDAADLPALFTGTFFTASLIVLVSHIQHLLLLPPAIWPSQKRPQKGNKAPAFPINVPEKGMRFQRFPKRSRKGDTSPFPRNVPEKGTCSHRSPAISPKRKALPGASQKASQKRLIFPKNRISYELLLGISVPIPEKP